MKNNKKIPKNSNEKLDKLKKLEEFKEVEKQKKYNFAKKLKTIFFLFSGSILFLLQVSRNNNISYYTSTQPTPAGTLASTSCEFPIKVRHLKRKFFTETSICPTTCNIFKKI